MASDEPVVIVSCDSHAGPKLKEQLRDYCPQKYLVEFDSFVAREEARAAPLIGSRLQHPNIERAGHYDGQSGPRPLEPERLEHAERRKQRLARA